MDLSQRLLAVQERLRTYPAAEVLAVSKKVPAERLREAHALGLCHFGENYLQEALEKMAALSDLELCWHFIGRIQRNKTRDIARHFDWIESVDREILLPRLDAERAGLPPLQILLEVAASGETSKGGVTPEQVLPLARAVQRHPHLRLRGLMALVHPEPAEAEKNFRQMAQLFRQLQAEFPNQAIDTLSMGTSGDYPQALAHGATEIRLGTILFGARPKE